MTIRKTVLLIAASTLLNLSLTACVVAPARVGVGASVGEVIRTAPPAPRVEVRSAMPGRDYIWIDGYWAWQGARHEWVPGHWAEPRAGYVWVPHRWEHVRGGGWRLREGYWAERRRR